MKRANLLFVGFLSVTQALALQSCGSKDDGTVSQPGSDAPAAEASVPVKMPAAEVLASLNTPVVDAGHLLAAPTINSPLVAPIPLANAPVGTDAVELESVTAGEGSATGAPVIAVVPPAETETAVVVVIPAPEEPLVDVVPGPVTNPLPEVPVPEVPAPELPAPEVPATQIARFTVWIDILDRSLVGVPLSEVADRLVATKAREVTFNLQALGRLYADQDPMFTTLRKKFKSLEDGIGGYQKWTDLEEEGRKAGKSAAVLKKLGEERKKALNELNKSLISTRFVAENSNIVPYITELRAALKAYKWKSVEDDRNDILQKLIVELEDVKNTKYDFTHLEIGNGVHEFRRKMRWFSMEARALNGMITLLPKDAPCPVADYARVVRDSIAKTKYAVLPGSDSEVNPVKLSPCLYVQVAKLVEDVNVVKAKAELADSLAESGPTDAVEVEDQAKVQKMLDDLVANNLFGLLQKELAAGLSY